jgi:hypothetical protein
MLSSSDLVSTLPQLDLYACTDFPLIVRFLAEPQPGSEFLLSQRILQVWQQRINKQMSMLHISNRVF